MLPITRLLIAWLAGIALADAAAPGAGPPAALALICALGLTIRGRGAAASLSSPAPAVILFLILALTLGALRLELSREDLGGDHAAMANGRGAVTVVGRVVAEPDRRCLLSLIHI